jgi:hypothetical protein
MQLLSDYALHCSWNNILSFRLPKNSDALHAHAIRARALWNRMIPFGAVQGGSLAGALRSHPIYVANFHGLLLSRKVSQPIIIGADFLSEFGIQPDGRLIDRQ